MNISKNDVSVKRNSKDTVFQMLFSEKQYQKQLLELLEPELGEINEELVENITLKNSFINESYNDLGLKYGERIIILVESQSNYSDNIALRQYLYLSNTIREYLKREGISLHRTSKIKLPDVGLYAVCINPPANCPEYAVLEIGHNGELTSNCRVRLVSLTSKENVIGQYLDYCHRFDKMCRSGQNDLKSLLDECINDGILKSFFEKRYKELISMQDILFSDYAVKVMFEDSEREKNKLKDDNEKLNGAVNELKEELSQKTDELLNKDMELKNANEIKDKLTEELKKLGVSQEKLDELLK